MTRSTTIKDFILDILVTQTKNIAEIESMPDNNGNISRMYTYQAFALETIAIELLGKVLSGKDLFKYVPGQPKVDFENAIETLFPEKYHGFKTLLYKELRCGMLHTFGPNRNIALGDKEIIGRRKKDHLSLSSTGKRVILFQEFHKDFTVAANKLVTSRDPKIQEKLNEIFLNIGPVSSI